MPEETKPVEREAFEAWQSSLPKCRVDCDGDLPGEAHDTNCPLFRKDFPTLEDAFYAGWDAALERAAQIAAKLDHRGCVLLSDCHSEIADAIRALKGSG